MMPPQKVVGFDNNRDIKFIDSEDSQEPSVADEQPSLGAEESLIEAEVDEKQMPDARDNETKIESPEQTEFDLPHFYQDLDLPNFQSYTADSALKAYKAGGRFQSKSWREMYDKFVYGKKYNAEKGSKKAHYEPYAVGLKRSHHETIRKNDTPSCHGSNDFVEEKETDSQELTEEQKAKIRRIHHNWATRQTR